MKRNVKRRLFTAGLCLGLMLAGTGFAGDVKPVDVSNFKEPIRLACIGDSITAGVRAKGESFADLIAADLGDRWQVANLGVSGATMLRKSGAAYNLTAQYTNALAMKADVVIIALGTNDSKPPVWKEKADFAADYLAMISDLRKANPNVIIYCCLPPPAFPGKWGISGATIKDEVIPLIRQVADNAGCRVIDLHAALEGHKETVPDTVHPNADGHKILAAAVHEALTGKPRPAR